MTKYRCKTCEYVGRRRTCPKCKTLNEEIPEEPGPPWKKGPKCEGEDA